MTLPHVLDFLRNHTLQDMEDTHKVDFSVCTVTGRKVSLNYNQFTADPHDPLARECRGMILSAHGGDLVQGLEKVSKDKFYQWELVARPIDRFMNHGQEGAAALDFTDPDVQVQDKLDGSMIIVSYDRFSEMEHPSDGWQVSTRSVPEANLPVDGHSNQTFASLFWMAVKNVTGMEPWEFRQFLHARGTDWTWCFELMTPYNPVVVHYQEWKLALLAVRNKITGQEWTNLNSLAAKLGVERPQTWEISSMEDLTRFVNSRPFSEAEGVVVVNTRTLQRLKVKSDQYVLGHRTRFSASPKNLLVLVIQEKADDIERYLTSHQKTLLGEVRGLLAQWVEYHDRQFQEIWDLVGNDRKTFAIEVQRREVWLGPLMARFTGQVPSTLAWLQRDPLKVSDSTLERILAWKE